MQNNVKQDRIGIVDIEKYLLEENADKIKVPKFKLSQSLLNLRKNNEPQFKKILESETKNLGPVLGPLVKKTINAAVEADSTVEVGEPVTTRVQMRQYVSAALRCIVAQSDAEHPEAINKEWLATFLCTCCSIRYVQKSDELMIFDGLKFVEAKGPVGDMLVVLLNYDGFDTWTSTIESHVIDLLKHKAPKIDLSDLNKNFYGFNKMDLNLATYEMEPPHPDHYVTMRSPIEPSEMATPVFDAFLKATFDDPTERQFAFSWLGSMFQVNRAGDSVLFMHSSGASGKSTLMTVWREICGAENVSSIKVQELGGQFGKQDLLGRVALITDENEPAKFDVATVKAISTGSPISVDQKFKKRVTMVPTLKMAFAFNVLPEAETTIGFFRRLILLPFAHTFEGDKADKHLIEKIRPEYPGIAFKALDELKRLAKDNFNFPESSAMVDAKNEYFDSSLSAVRLFIRENLIAKGDEELARDVILNRFKAWVKDSSSDENGYTKPKRFWSEYKNACRAELGISYAERKSGRKIVLGVSFRNDETENEGDETDNA